LPDPTYHRLGDHTEVFQIDYDPRLISYKEILDIFWVSHNPSSKAWSRQYMAMILYHDQNQKQIAQKSKEIVEKEQGIKVQTEIQPLDKFYLAEDYHQKYYLQNTDQLAFEIKTYYPDIEDLTNSTVAARLNGIAGGYGDPKILERELDEYGLSPQVKKILQDVVYD